MVNYRVDSLDALLEELKKAGVEVGRTAKITTTAASPGSWIRRETASSCGSRRKQSESAGKFSEVSQS
jgi:hypothetical protein